MTVVVRRYEPGDLDVVRAIHAAAFGRDDGDRALPPEVRLLDALLEAGDVIEPLSLVALAGGEPVGHVVCSRASVGATAVAALGPIGVLPGEQGHGVGTALMHAVLGAADGLGLPLVALLGSPAYYSRFGFVAAGSLGIEAPVVDWGAFFQVRTLSAYDPELGGVFRYAPAFAAL